MFAPFIACLLLAGIMVYFGIHVLKREIIFIDIALAQIAALGGVVTTVLHEFIHPHEGHAHHHEGEEGYMAYFLSLLFCTLAAGIFTLLKSKKIRIPMEAVIGIAYAVATTGAIIILDKGAGSDVHVHDMLIGSILWVTWHQIINLSIVIALVGAFHIIFRKKFIRLTDSYMDDCSMKNYMLWDFLFYLSFGIVIVKAVVVGGILTVFAFLIIPASISALLAVKWLPRMLIGLSAGAVVILASLYFAWDINVPCSPLIIAGLGILLLVAAVLRKFIIKSE